MKTIHLSPQQRAMLKAMVESPLGWDALLPRCKTGNGSAGRRRTLASLAKLGLVRWAYFGEKIIDSHGTEHTVTHGGYVSTFAGRKLAVTLRLVKPRSTEA